MMSGRRRTRRNYHLVIQTILRSVKDRLYAADRAQSIQPSDIHTVGVLHVCHDVARLVSHGSLHGNSVTSVNETNVSSHETHGA